MKLSYPRRFFAAFVCAVALLAPPVGARTRKGDKLLKEGQKAEATQDYDSAVTYYEQALEEDSREPAYMLSAQRAREKASEQHIAQGKKLLEPEGMNGGLAPQKLTEALVQFQKALLIEPSSQIALQLIAQTTTMVNEKNKLPEGTRILTPAERARHDIELRINSLEGPPMLRPINNQISSLKMNNQTSRVLYESVGKLAGINVLFDPQGIDALGGATRNFNLDLNNVTLEEALNYVALVTHTFWKPISRNAIFVTQESEPKRQEFQDEVVKVFYIQNASTPNEFTEIFNGVRTGAKLTTGIFQVASQSAIIARGSSDTMALVEKLVHDLDRPKAEVLIDVMVWEVAKSHVTNLGLALAGQGNNLLSVAPNSTTAASTTSGTAGTTTTTSGISLSRLGKISSNNFTLTLPGAIAQALLTDSRSRLLQNPQVRVTDGGKASLKIGSKIPYVSGSLNSAVATPGSIPYATTQFQQVDVGVNIDVQPHVNGPDDISMHIKVEISNVVSTETIAGVQQPIIGQKVSEADVRMRDGEYSILGGLSTDTDSTSVSGLPGVSNMPVLGYLFGTRQKDREKDDIIVALVPRIIRAPAVDEQPSEGVLAGTERVVRVERRAQQPAPTAPAQQQAPPTAPPGQAPPALPPPGGHAQLLPPTNNPRMPLNSQSSPLPVVPFPVAPVQASVSRAVPPPAARPLVVQPLPPGTDVTPLSGMQQMGLAPDPVDEGASPQSAPGNQLLGSPDGAQQDAPQPSVPQDPGSYAVESAKPDTPAPSPQAAATRPKNAVHPRVQLTSAQAAKTDQKTVAAVSTAADTPTAAQPVQVLEGHLTQQPDASTTTATSQKPK